MSRSKPWIQSRTSRMVRPHVAAVYSRGAISSLPDSAQCAQSLSPRAPPCCRPAHSHAATVHAASSAAHPASGDQLTVSARAPTSPVGSYTRHRAQRATVRRGEVDELALGRGHDRGALPLQQVGHDQAGGLAAARRPDHQDRRLRLRGDEVGAAPAQDQGAGARARAPAARAGRARWPSARCAAAARARSRRVAATPGDAARPGQQRPPATTSTMPSSATTMKPANSHTCVGAPRRRPGATTRWHCRQRGTR